MTDEKKYTEREVVERERKAFEGGCWHMRYRIDPVGCGREGARVYNELIGRIDEFYPLPKKRKVTRRRAWSLERGYTHDQDTKAGVCLFRVGEDGLVEGRSAQEDGTVAWKRAGGPLYCYTPNQLTAFANLLRRPTEEVEVVDDD